MFEVTSPVLANAQAAIARGNFAEAERLLFKHLSERETDVRAWHLLGNVQVKRGDMHASLVSYNRAVELDPTDAQLWCLRGIVLHNLRNWDAALQSYSRAMQIMPNFPQALLGATKILISADRREDALALYRRGLNVSPCHPVILLEEAQLLSQLGRFDESLKSFRNILRADPENRDARNGSAVCLQKLGRFDEALSILDMLVAQYPNLAYLHYNRGTLLNDRHDFAAALECFDRAIAMQPDVAEMHNNRGHALRCMHHLPEGLAACERALSLDHNDPRFHYNRGLILLEMGDFKAALISLEAAAARAPQKPEILYAKATAFESLKRYSEASLAYDHVLQIDPNHAYAFGGLANVALCGCDWVRQEKVMQELPARMQIGRDVIPPFILLGYGLSEAEQLAATKRYRASWQERPPGIRKRFIERKENPPLRLGYVSADYHDHATTYLLTGLIESHDRTRFNVHGISTSPTGEGQEARRLLDAFDAIHSVRFRSDEEIANLIRELGIDILIDLKGYTQHARPGIFAQRAAPVQISWLGYPATSGGNDLEYLIADRIVLPPDRDEFYTEKIIRLPTCYQANDDKREVAVQTASRSELGLPEEGFVFCCFNNSWKITRTVFSVWMRLLTAVEGSVLWLLDDNDTARKNLISAAKDHGLDPNRLVFAPRVPVASHLCRHLLADLLLDTIPYNAHTGATDALWAGLPLLTCTGTTFPGRVATSLLQALDLPELICASLEDYEARALKLARNSATLKRVRDQLCHARKGPGLFNTKRFTSEIEAAYLEIWRAHSS
jgi:protein O-GlcNAc transferase